MRRVADRVARGWVWQRRVAVAVVLRAAAARRVVAAARPAFARAAPAWAPAVLSRRGSVWPVPARHLASGPNAAPGDCRGARHAVLVVVLGAALDAVLGAAPARAEALARPVRLSAVRLWVRRAARALLVRPAARLVVQPEARAVADVVVRLPAVRVDVAVALAPLRADAEVAPAADAVGAAAPVRLVAWVWTRAWSRPACSPIAPAAEPGPVASSQPARRRAWRATGWCRTTTSACDACDRVPSGE